MKVCRAVKQKNVIWCKERRISAPGRRGQSKIGSVWRHAAWDRVRKGASLRARRDEREMNETQEVSTTLVADASDEMQGPGDGPRESVDMEERGQGVGVERRTEARRVAANGVEDGKKKRGRPRKNTVPGKNAKEPTELIFKLERRGHGWGEEIIPYLTVEKRPVKSSASSKRSTKELKVVQEDGDSGVRVIARNRVSLWWWWCSCSQ